MRYPLRCSRQEVGVETSGRESDKPLCGLSALSTIREKPEKVISAAPFYHEKVTLELQQVGFNVDMDRYI